jgi:hypothetical protein
MTAENEGRWNLIVQLGIFILVYVGAVIWIFPLPPVPNIPASADYQGDQRLAKLEQAVTTLTQALQVKQAQHASAEAVRVTAPANTGVSRQDLTQLIREEVRRVVAQEGPEARRAREEALAEAEILNSPENRTAYQSASGVVRTAMAAKRWTEEDKETFRSAFGLLTNDQRMELMNTLVPAINGGEVKVEVIGPLF